MFSGEARGSDLRELYELTGLGIALCYYSFFAVTSVIYLSLSLISLMLSEKTFSSSSLLAVLQAYYASYSDYNCSFYLDSINYRSSTAF